MTVVGGRSGEVVTGDPAAASATYGLVVEYGLKPTIRTSRRFPQNVFGLSVVPSRRNNLFQPKSKSS